MSKEKSTANSFIIIVYDGWDNCGMLLDFIVKLESNMEARFDRGNQVWAALGGEQWHGMVAKLQIWWGVAHPSKEWACNLYEH